MTTYFARKEYVYSGGDAIFSIPFSYIKKEHISVLVNDEATENYTYLNNSQIQVNDTLKTNDVVSIIRSTPIDSRMVVFSDTSILDKKAQNLAQEQVFDAIQEVYDNNIKFNIDTLDIIEANKEELEQTIANNKQEVLNIQADFEQEVNTTIETVTEAAEKINNFEQAVEEAKAAAQTATSKADETQEVLANAVTEMDSKLSAANTAVENATQQANLATQKAQEIFDINPANTNLSNLTEDGIKVIKDNSGSGLEICDIGMALYVDETKGLRRYLNGQIVDINTNTQAFLNRLKQIQATNPDYFTTEDNWQSEALLNIDGCVYKFVLNYSGDTVVSVRLPKYPDYVEINAGGTLPVVGNGMTLGFTDGTVNFGSASGSTGNYHMQFSQGSYGANVGSALGTGAPSGAKNVGVTTDPTKSGIQTTLKQTKLKMRYFIQIATGAETENNIINEIELNNPFSLFDSKYSDHELNNLSWLKSEGQWNAKAVYPTAYDKLLKVYNGTETVEGLSVKLSTEDYTDYDFVLNTADETFRLPLKTKLASGKAVVGTGISLGLTDGSTNYGLYSEVSVNRIIAYSGSYGQTVRTSGGGAGTAPSPSAVLGVTTDPTKSGIELSDSGLYLYFYVGETVQNANLIDAGRIGEQLANKQDKLSRYPIEISNKSLMPSWYVVYSDGWCEQGSSNQIAGTISATNKTVVLLKKYKDANYTVNYQITATYTQALSSAYWQIISKTTTNFVVQSKTTASWRACGYLAEGEY